MILERIQPHHCREELAIKVHRKMAKNRRSHPRMIVILQLAFVFIVVISINGECVQKVVLSSC